MQVNPSKDMYQVDQALLVIFSKLTRSFQVGYQAAVSNRGLDSKEENLSRCQKQLLKTRRETMDNIARSVIVSYYVYVCGYEDPRTEGLPVMVG